MGRHSRTDIGLIGGLGAAVAALSFVVSLELSTATASAQRVSAQRVSAQRVSASRDFVVDRTLKGDRQPLHRGRASDVLAPAAEPPLPVGCESLFSTIGRKTKTGVARGCLS